MYFMAFTEFAVFAVNELFCTAGFTFTSTFYKFIKHQLQVTSHLTLQRLTIRPKLTLTLVMTLNNFGPGTETSPSHHAITQSYLQ